MMRDEAIRSALLAELRRAVEADPEALIVEELGLCEGTARVDVAVIGAALAGYEIKSDRDTLARLPGQIEIYNRTFDLVTVVAAGAHVEKVSRLVPGWYGITEAREEAGAVSLATLRPTEPNPEIDPFAVVQLLWRDESLNLLREFGIERGVKSKGREEIWRRLAGAKPPEEICRLVREGLRRRQNWRGKTRARILTRP